MRRSQLSPKTFSGGVNNRDVRVQNNQARKIVNAFLDERGGAGKRPGATSIASLGVSGDRVLSMYTFYKAGATPQLLVHLSDGTLKYSTNYDTGSPTFADIATGLSTTAPFSFETFNGKVYMSNGVDDYRWWDGATQTTAPSAPKAKYLRLWKDTMWAAGVTAQPDRTYESGAGDAEVWPALGFVDLGRGDGDEIMGLGSDGLTLLTFKRRRYWSIYDPVELSNRVVDYDKGAESHFSIIAHEGAVYFFSRQGICLHLGDAPARVVSGNIAPVFHPSILNFNALTTVWAYEHQGRIGWTVPEVNSNGPTFQIELYDQLPEHPFVFQRLPARCFASLRKGATEFLFCGKTTANKVLKAFEGGTDDGTTFQTIIETEFDSSNLPLYAKYLENLLITGRGKFFVGAKVDDKNAIAKLIAVDLSGDVDVWGDENWNEPGSTWGPSSSIQQIELKPDLYGNSFSIIFTDSEAGTGTKPIDVGGVGYSVAAGEWAVYGIQASVVILGTGRRLVQR